VAIGEDLEAKADASATLTAGMQFNGFRVDNISGLSGRASASARGAGQVQAGLQFRVAVGVANAADVHFDVKPSIELSAQIAEPHCSLDLKLGSQIGISILAFQLNKQLPAPTKNLAQCAKREDAGSPKLSVTQTGPPGAFPNQAFNYTITVRNSGDGAARGVQVVDTLPSDGSFVSGPAGSSPSSPSAGSTYTIPVGDIAAGEARSVIVRWKAPDSGSAANTAFAKATNSGPTGPAKLSVPVGTSTLCNPCGAATGGTALRNRDHGSISINAVPAGASVGRAVLVWGVLYNGDVPPGTITFQGHPVSADVGASPSGNLCWSDSGTIGYAADVTDYVTGNGTYDITNPVQGEVRPDSDPYGTLPFTNGASLIVLYNDGGSHNQVLSDFSYDTNTDADQGIHRSFSGIHSVGGPASLTLVGSDGQTNGGEDFTFTGATSVSYPDTFDGSDPLDGPGLTIGNLWDTDIFDVGSLLPAGQETFAVDHEYSADCVGVGAAVLQVSQLP